MNPPEVGDLAPPFDLPAVGGDDFTLTVARGQPVVLLFYPRDFGAVCTKQMCEVRDAFRELSRLEAVVVAISTDSLEQHESFRRKHRLPFRLLTDKGGFVAKRYGARGLFGRAKRATFVIDSEGVVRHAQVQFPLFRPALGEIAGILSGLRQAGHDAGGTR